MRILNHEIVARGPAGSWLYMLHGIFGAGRNWGTVARRVTRARPEWGVILVDLREHGGSRGFAPPHTVRSAAADLAVLGAATGRVPRALLGHSFGGKVALRHAADRPAGLEQVWVVDSTPEARAPAGSAWRMLESIRRLPDCFASREELVEALGDTGFSEPVARWMATNLEARDGGFGWRFDLDAVESLILDFFRVDLWHAVEPPPPGVEIRFVKAASSDVMSDETVRRIRLAAAGGQVRIVGLEGGHWLNADNPEALADLISRGLPAA